MCEVKGIGKKNNLAATLLLKLGGDYHRKAETEGRKKEADICLR